MALYHFMLLLETIKIKNNKLFNIHYHNQRMNNARIALFRADNYVDLEKVISIPESSGILKCRVIYGREIQKVEFEPYEIRKIKSLKIIHADSINYRYKYVDRTILNKLLELKEDCDDILIVKNNLITDASFANIAFYDGINWVTPAFPLLRGTKRAKLIDEGKILEKNIFLDNLKSFKKAILFNSMIGLTDGVFVEIKNIF